MAKVYRSVGGRPIQKVLAVNDGVQSSLEEYTLEIAVRAEEKLLQHHFEGHAAIEVDHGDVDWYVTLSDERGQKAAMSIEYGRKGYIDPETGEVWGEMEGLFILHDATNLPRKKRPVDRERRSRWGD